MFEKLRIKLTGIYTAIFSLLLIFFTIISFYIVFMAFTGEEEILIKELSRHEGDEYIESRELPVSEYEFVNERIYSYIISPNGEIIIDQLTGAPLANAILEKINEWPKDEEETPLLVLKRENGDIAIFITSRHELIENGSHLGSLYMFKNLTVYYHAIITAIGLIGLSLILFLVISGFSGYYLAGKNLMPIHTAYQKQKDFVADASHELRTPLTILTLAAEGLKNDSDTQLSPFAQKTLKNIQIETERMTKLSNDLLTLARGDEETIPIFKESFILNNIIKQVIKPLNELAKQKEIILIYNNQIKNLKILADQERISQLVTILIDNAIKYSNSKSEITITLRKNKNFIDLSIQDNGIGVSLEDQEKIFDRFYRVNKARSRTNEGLGLGLSIADWIVKKHKGTISIASKLNEGSCFTIHLPIN